MKQLRISRLLLLILSLALFSCGGGGTDASAELPPPNDQADVAGDSDSRVDPAPDPEPALPELRIGPNGRFFSKENGTPFFWLSDTQWEIIHKSIKAEADEVLADRKAKGFTAIQIPLLFNWSMTSPTRYGELPGTPDNWNEAYFEYADYIIDATIAQGMHPVIFPAWGNLSGGVNNIFDTPEQAYRYGQWIANRYKDRPGVVYIAGGDRGPAKDTLGITASIAEGIKSMNPDRLMSFHSWYQTRNEGHANASWIDFSTFQTSHNKCTDAEEYAEVTETMMNEWNETPHRPFIDIEPRFEDIGDGGTCGYAFTPYQARISAYWAVFAGSAGIGYSKSPLWYWAQWGDNDPGFDFNRIRELLDAEFGGQIHHLKDLMLSRPYFSREPNPSLTGSTNGVGATLGDGYIMVYAGQGQPFEINTESLSGKTVQAWWFNPRDGSSENAGTFSGSETLAFDPPGIQQDDNDWVLVLDDAAQQFPAPGGH